MSNNSPKQLPNRDNVTSQQCDTLLQVAGLMDNVIINPHRDFDGGGTKLDGGAHTAAVNTFVNACAKLDEIINAKDRFTFEPQNLIEAQYFQALKQQTLFTQEQTEAIRELNTPHARYRPDLMRLKDGNWMVVLGPDNDLENSIVGVGTTPQQAIEAFDGVFVGSIPQHLLDYLAAREKAIDTNTTPPPFTKKRNPKRKSK